MRIVSHQRMAHTHSLIQSHLEVAMSGSAIERGRYAKSICSCIDRIHEVWLNAIELVRVAVELDSMVVESLGVALVGVSAFYWPSIVISLVDIEVLMIAGERAALASYSCTKESLLL